MGGRRNACAPTGLMWNEDPDRGARNLAHKDVRRPIICRRNAYGHQGRSVEARSRGDEHGECQEESDGGGGEEHPKLLNIR